MRYSVLILWLILSTRLSAGEIQHTVTFNRSDFIFKKFKGYDILELKNCGTTTEIGYPMLPEFSCRILIPAGATVTKIEVISKVSSAIPGEYKICPAQPPQPFLFERAIEWVEPEETVYSLSTPYPAELVKHSHTGSLGGYRIAGFLVYPIQYIPRDKKLIFTSKIVFQITYENRVNFVPQKTLKEKAIFGDIVKKLVLNPYAVETFSPPTTLGLPSGVLPFDTVEYVVITADSFVQIFEQLTDWKTKKGVQAKVVSLNFIYDNYKGTDNAEKIRNFIIDANSTWGTIWFLLGGQCDREWGQEVIPRRDVWYKRTAEYPVDKDTIPSDLYFSDLDGTWNADGDTVWGEKEDAVDLYSDVFVGRAPVRTKTQVTTFINKVLTYEQNPPPNYLKKALLPATYLFDEPEYWGDLVNNAIADITPYGWEDAKLYESNGTLSRAILIDSLNAGFGFVHYAAHGRPDGVGSPILDYILSSDDVDNLTNESKLGIHNSIACYIGAVDWVPGGDCFAEHLLNKDGGAVAVIMNSRTGVGRPSVGMYYSELLDTSFYHETFRSTYLYHDHIGVAHAVSKDCYVSWTTWEDRWPWCIYELNLFGDPELPMWTDEPKNLIVEHDSVIWTRQTSFKIRVTDNGTSVESALVCVMKGEDSVYVRGYTNPNGVAILSLLPPPTTYGTLSVTCTAHNFLPYIGTARVVSSWKITINPDTVQVNTLTPVEITISDTLNQGVRDVEIRILGLGVSEFDTTNIAGQCIININAGYGEVLKCNGRKIGESWDLLKDSIRVVGGMELISPDLTSQVTEIGLVDTIARYCEGTITGSCENSGFTLFAKGSGVDTSVYTNETSADLSIVPTQLGTLCSYIAKTGYRVYKETFPVIRVFGRLVGTVADVETQNPIEGVVIKAYESGIDTSLVHPVFIDTSDVNGNYSSKDSIPVNKYDIYTMKFCYLPFFATHITKYNVDTFNIQLQPAPPGLVYGTVTDSTGLSLSAAIKVCHTDNMELYETVYTDATGFYEVVLPYFTYKFYVFSPYHSVASRDVIVDSDSLELNFVMAGTPSILVINDDDGTQIPFRKETGQSLIASELHKSHMKKIELKKLYVTNKSKAGESASRIAALLTEFGYNVKQEQSSTTDPVTWENYNFIVWSDGDDISPLGNTTLRDLLKRYVRSGKILLIEGGELGYNMCLSDFDFARTVLHIDAWYTDDAGSLILQNTSHQLATYPNTLPNTIPVFYSNSGDEDALHLLEGATLIYGTEDYNNAAGILVHEPTPPGGQIVFYAFNFMAIDSATGAKLLENTVHYLLTQVGVELTQKPPNLFELCLPFPNPFTKKTVIKYRIPEVKNQKPEIRLQIYDICGRVVRTFPISNFQFPISNFQFYNLGWL
ncbi:MAG: C25 family cysteine peptidase [bacterium]|nr:C25 family cysteine peptidase [bacterium]